MKANERLVGFLSAVIIHLIAGIIFMLIKISSQDVKALTQEYEIIFQDIDQEGYFDQEELKRLVINESEAGFERELLNIARNLSEKPDPEINPEEYVNNVKEEMIRSGMLGPDNFIDEQKRMKDNQLGDGIDISKDDVDEDKNELTRKSNEIASKYSGPTRIYYNLPGRTHVYLPLPIYKCEGGGKVTLSIEVNPKGEVVKASVMTSESSIADICLIQAAIESALLSRFTPDGSTVKNIIGTLTYIFVPQWQIEE